MQFKRVFYTLILLSFTVVYANYYVGIDLGLTNLAVRTNLTYPIESTAPKQAKFTEGAYGFGIKLLGGYTLELVPEQWLLSTELNYDYFNLGTQYSIDNWFLTNGVSTNNKLHQLFGIFALPTYQLAKNTTIFLGPGAVYGNFSTHYNDSAGNIGVTNNTNRWLSGWAIKGGLMTQITRAWQLEISYQYTRLVNVSAIATEPNSGDSVAGTYYPMISTASVGLRYYFAEQSNRHRAQLKLGELPLPFN